MRLMGWWCADLSALEELGVGAGGGTWAPVDLNNQIIGISKNKGFLTPLRPLTLSSEGHRGLNLNPSIPEHLAHSHVRITPTARRLPQRRELDPADVDCWDNTAPWSAAASGFLPCTLLVFAAVLQCQQQGFVNAKMLKANDQNSWEKMQRA